MSSPAGVKSTLVAPPPGVLAPSGTPSAPSASSGGTGRQRGDEGAKAEEELGVLRFDTIEDDFTLVNLKKLLALKCIIATRLPNMPKDYISRLVFDVKHRSIVAVRVQKMENGEKSERVVGGICFRPFSDRNFAEIAFCAVAEDQQVRGIGTRLMNHLKDHLVGVKVLNFLTYADNSAIEYFKKQGFTDVLDQREAFDGYIKDYVRSTLMKCKVREGADYLDVPRIVKRQKAALSESLKEKSEHVYDGLPVSAFPKNGAIDLAMIAGIGENIARTGHEQMANQGRDVKSLHRSFKGIIKKLNKHPKAWPFREPVDFAAVPDYRTVVKQPMDLQTLMKNLVEDPEHRYRTKESFLYDMRLIFSNARLYNDARTDYYKCANELEAYFEQSAWKLAFPEDFVGDKLEIGGAAAAGGVGPAIGSTFTASSPSAAGVPMYPIKKE